MIRTVIFDLGRVLVPFDFQRGYLAMSEHCGLPPEEVRARLGRDGLVPGFESGEFDGPEFVRRVAELMETQISYERFSEIWSSVFLPHTLIPESMVEAIRRNYRTVLLSNTNPIHFDMLSDTYPILKHFDAYVLSHEVKAMKPLPRIYEVAIQQAQCAPGECFFTDDVAEYVEGAKRAGIDAVQFQDHAQIEAELRARGVNW
ncbi:HAD family phosphatase [uncultured Paludibaculum sp.]|uniref:HAD family hydrolase n=1 Tax=uncultured Paludibaculum sp. TaxID=1765020 RepID=UPI002AAB82D7|nr:HAD family phosphatase [uncultured Paludibaculum sp.]